MVLLWIFCMLIFAVIGFFLAIFLLVDIYTTDHAYWNTRILPILDDVKDWVDSGNKLKNYPKERMDRFR